MKTNEIYTAYVSWGEDGKRRPVLIVNDEKRNIYCYRITSKYQNKSKRIKQNYFPLANWSKEGLMKQSYVDIGEIIRLPKKLATFHFIGELTFQDTKSLIEFIKARYDY